MDDDKTVIEKLTDAVKGAASTIMDVASNAAGGAMQATTKKIAPGEARVGAGGDEPIYIPAGTDAAAVPPALFPIRQKRPARPRKAAAKSGVATAAGKAPPAKSAKKNSKKTSKKTPKETSKKTAKKTAQKASKKTSKKTSKKASTKASKKASKKASTKASKTASKKKTAQKDAVKRPARTRTKKKTRRG